MKKTICFLIAALTTVAGGYSQTVQIVYSKLSPQASYAAEKIEAAMVEKGYSKRENKAEYEINISVNAGSVGAEAFSVATNRKRITVTGGDDRGLIYGSLSVAEDIRNGIRLENIKAKNEKPNYPLRAVKFDLPWDTYRHSMALDLHMETCKDVDYWKAFLDMMAENRLNSLSLWNLHPYTFMIKPKNFPEASP
ncbi:MAG TPA: glycoside hydrolase family 20 zincin-like fold domain-containing protein, partial [Chitinophagaceae bacterium]|nr:glycoside hydrolase family 20 zincin-like fold domain-containing protein [Chitinophagaceae bacterium]